MESGNIFLVDALLLERVSQEDPDDLLPFVMATPVACPGCEKNWVLMLNRDVCLEVQQGRVGRGHLKLLLDRIESSCAAGTMPPHLRTDGESVWEPRSFA